MPVLDPYAISSSPELEDEATGHGPDIHESGIERAEEHLSQTSNEPYTGGPEGLTAAEWYPPSEDNTLHQPNLSYPDDSFIHLPQRRVNEEATSVEFLPQSQTILPPATGALGFILNPSATLSPTVAPAETFHGIPDLVHVAQGSSATRKVQFRAGTETSHKTAFLLRHFSEVTGRWYVFSLNSP